MPYLDYTPETIVARGDAIYQQHRAKLSLIIRENFG